MKGKNQEEANRVLKKYFKKLEIEWENISGRQLEISRILHFGQASKGLHGKVTEK